MTDPCPLVCDLLPLYADGLLSEPSAQWVRAHLAHCPACAARLNAFTQPLMVTPPESVPLRRVKKALRRKRVMLALLAMCVCAALLISAFAFLTAPQILPYSEDLLTLLPLSDSRYVVVFSDAVTGYALERVRTPTDEPDAYALYAYTTLWDRLFRPRGAQSAVLDVDETAMLSYAPNPGGEDVPLLGTSAMPYDASITLPRLTLTYYFCLALLLLAVLVLLRVGLRKTAAAPVLTQAALFSLCYLAAQLCIKGVHFTTYTLQRDLSLIILLTLSLDLGVHLLTRLLHARR